MTHLYCSSFQTPRGKVGERTDHFRSRAVALSKPFAKYSFVHRMLQELEYGCRASREIVASRPAAVISANTPLLAALVLQIWLRIRRIDVVFWQQDVYSIAMSEHLENRLGRIGQFVGWTLRRIERWLLRSSDHVVVISDDFLPMLRQWGVDESHVTVVENWAPLDDLPTRPRPNDWSREHEVDDGEVVLLYSGTLGLKHEPSVLLELARALRTREDARVIVASEGIGARWLAEHASPDDPLELLPFQPFSALPDMLATADVLLVLLEPAAGDFSVPSKVLTYQCAGRAILGAMPASNLASRNLVDSGSGVVVDPGDAESFVAAAFELIDDAEARARFGKHAREYAEDTFDIDRIADRFVDAIESARSG